MDFAKDDHPPSSSDNAAEDCNMCKMIQELIQGEPNRCAQGECIYQRYFDDINDFEMLLYHYDAELLTDIVKHKHAADPLGLTLWIKTKTVDVRAILNMPSDNLPRNPSPGPSDSNNPSLPSLSANPSSQDPSSLPTSHPSNIPQDPSSLPTSNPSASCPPDSSTPLPSRSLSSAIAHRLRPRKPPLPVPGTSKVARRKKKRVRVPATASTSTFYPPPASNPPSPLVSSSSRMLLSGSPPSCMVSSGSPPSRMVSSGSPPPYMPSPSHVGSPSGMPSSPLAPRRTQLPVPPVPVQTPSTSVSRRNREKAPCDRDCNCKHSKCLCVKKKSCINLCCTKKEA